jgi:2,5-diketo-D-gluconate reductase B
MIRAALEGGFRHIDTGQIYRDEAETSKCAASSGIPRFKCLL